jgi:very-short-patch-repair endonuclease
MTLVGTKIIGEETRKRMSESAVLRYRKYTPPMLGRIHSLESKRKMSIHSKGRILTELWKQKIRAAKLGKPSSFKGKSHSDKSRQLNSNSHIGRTASIETKQKMSVAHLGSKNPNYRKIFNKEHRSKIRTSVMSYRLRHGGCTPYIGRHEQTLLDTQERIARITILRQYLITKLGYIVDGYCTETNTVYEVYEKYHDTQVQKDLQREIEICNFLSCDFIIIWDRL